MVIVNQNIFLGNVLFKINFCSKMPLKHEDVVLKNTKKTLLKFLKKKTKMSKNDKLNFM